MGVVITCARMIVVVALTIVMKVSGRSGRGWVMTLTGISVLVVIIGGVVKVRGSKGLLLLGVVAGCG